VLLQELAVQILGPNSETSLYAVASVNNGLSRSTLKDGMDASPFIKPLVGLKVVDKGGGAQLVQPADELSGCPVEQSLHV
jgi:hypothetical protein